MAFWDDAADFVGGGIGAIGGALGGAAGAGMGALGGLMGGAGEAIGLGGSSGAPPVRGEARGGGAAPDKANFELGWDPAGVDALGKTAQDIGQQGRGQMGTGETVQQMSYGAANRATPQFDPTQAKQSLAASQGRGVGQGATAADIAARGGQTTGSAAQAVRQQGVDDSINAAMALAGSGGGLGGNAAALAQATQTAPAEIARAANEAAQLQASSDDADAQRQLQALGMSGDLTSAARGQDIQEAGMYGDLAGQDVQTALQGMSLNDALQLGLGDMALGYGQQGLDAQLGAGQLGLGAENLGLQGALGALEGTMGYEQALNDLYGIDSAQQLGARQIDVSKTSNIMQGLQGMGSALGGIAALSDVRSKQNVRLTKLRDRYAALEGVT